MKKILLLIIGVLALTACSSDDTEEKIVTVMDDLMPSITVIYSLTGPGDNGYNDKMVEGVVHFCDSVNVAMHTHRPTSLDEAKTIVNQWMVETESRQQRSMLLLVGNEYESLASSIQSADGKKRCVLLVESQNTDMPNGVATASVDRKSVMYLAGALASRTNAYIMAAMPGDKVVESAIKAFKDGYEAHNQGNKLEDVHYLSNNEQGYSMLNAAYKYTQDLISKGQNQIEETNQSFDSRFILLPMAGGSNTGAYFYMMQSFDEKRTFQSVIGMDADYNAQLEMSPFSIVIHVDKMLLDCISRWLKGKSLPSHRTYTMSEGYADVVVNPSFNNKGLYSMHMFVKVEDDGYEDSYIGFLPDDYWTENKEKLRKEAEEYGTEQMPTNSR